MFWKKKTPVMSDAQRVVQAIAHADANGEPRTELTYRLLQVAQEAEKIRVSMQSIVDNYGDGLSDLTREACHLFSTPLAVEIEGLERSIIDMFEEVEGLADKAQDLVIKMGRHTQKGRECPPQD